jgi:Holliday junction DNA helicase RuvA
VFAYLRGTLARKAPGVAVIDVGGVGYEVQIPLSTFYELGEEGRDVSLRITARLRDDSLVLYGFGTAAEQDLFRHLIGVAGVGPRTAIAILSGMPVAELLAALAQADAERLRTIPGVGKRTSERLVVELKDRAARLAAAAAAPPGGPARGELREDVVSALVNLGYPPGQAEKVTSQALAGADGEPTFEDLLRRALRRLHR